MSGQGKPMGNEQRLTNYGSGQSARRWLTPAQMRRSVKKLNRHLGTKPKKGKKPA